MLSFYLIITLIQNKIKINLSLFKISDFALLPSDHPNCAGDHESCNQENCQQDLTVAAAVVDLHYGTAMNAKNMYSNRKMTL